MKWDDADKYYVSLWVNRIAVGLMTILMVPTLAILGTWNTLPGEKLYPVKRTLENAVLAMVGENFGLRTEVQAQLVDQRFEESQAVIESPEASIALAEFTSQIQKATGEIIANKNSEVNVEVRKEKAVKLAAQLREYEAKLETKKEEQQVVNAVQATPSNNPSVAKKIDQPAQPPTPVTLQSSTQQVSQTVVTTTTSTTTSQSIQNQQIVTTQQTIQQAIQMLEQVEERGSEQSNFENREKREDRKNIEENEDEKHSNNGNKEKKD